MKTPLDEPTRDLLITQAYRQGLGGTPMTLLAIIGVSLVHWVERGDLLSPAWLAASVVLALLRGVSIWVVLRRITPLSLTLRENLFTFPLTLTGLSWAALPFIVFPGSSLVEMFGMICILAGMAGGSASVLAPVNWSARFYLLAVIAPGSILFDAPSIAPIIHALGACFLVIMFVAHGTTRRLMIDAIQKRIRNDALLRDVEAKRNEVETLNAKLQQAELSLREHNDFLEREVAARTERNRLAYSVIHHTAEGILVASADRTIVEVNPAFTGITGYASREAIGRNIDVLRSRSHDDRFYNALWERIVSAGKWEGELWSRRKDGSEFLEHRSINAVRDADGTTTHYVVVFRDITDDYHKDEQLRHMAKHDSLTGLANRALLYEHLHLEIAQAKRRGESLAVLFLDLDDFKTTNDALGHGLGDLLLVEVAKRLGRHVRAADLLARLGGDEFVVMLTNVTHPEDCARIATKLQESLTDSFELNGNRLFVSTSIGIATFPDDGTDAETLLKHADMALYAAKGEGKNRFHFFQPAIAASAEAKREMECALRVAVEQDQLSLHYQPKVDAVTGEIAGFEALIRWFRDGSGFIPPDQFIPVAEECGLINAIGRFALRESCRQAAEWYRQGRGWQRIAINVSARQLAYQDFVGEVRASLHDFGVPPTSIEIEVTESAVMDQPEKTLPQLTALSDMGIAIAIDDFGTGHSSLAYLRYLPLDVLKIDRAFVKEAAENDTAKEIIQAIVRLSHALSLRVVAEGVETTDQAEILRQIGCHELQGYYFARPARAEAVDFSGYGQTIPPDDGNGMRRLPFFIGAVPSRQS